MPVNTINQDQEYAFQSSEFMSLSYQKGSDWVVVPGITDYSISGGSSPSRDVVAANTSVAKRIGRPRTGDVSISAYYIPTDFAWREIRQAQLDRTLMQWRLDTNGDVVWQSESGGSQATVSGNGEVTFTSNGTQSAPTLDNYSIGRGAVMKIGTANLIIDNIESDDTIHVLDLDDYGHHDQIDPAVNVKIWNPPPMRYEFSAYVTQGADSNMPAEGELTTTLMLTPRRPLPAPVIIIDSL